MNKGADIILAIGNSGSGKSSSLRDLPPKDTIVLRPSPKSYPFPGGDANYIEGENQFTTDDMGQIRETLNDPDLSKFKYVVIEDLNHFFNARTTSKSFIGMNSGNGAFAKWNIFASDVIQSFILPAQQMAEGTTLIIIAHTEIKDDGTIGLKTSGKLLDNNLYIPSYVTYVLHSLVLGEGKEVSYNFLTNADGAHLAKSPAGVFKQYISSNMMEAIQRIKKYKAGDIEKIVWK